ncbi:MAG: hypothetical protein P4L85_20155 [Paludisphaera borealis]|uniref:hypothetical protein n=1 Tax=Paludisphaera borealis TaxID=1387353 RepID=UPI00283B7BFE|nr:hypothetical protein [Paludisphaera borealis]MDR3621676.1 hypothetical protein [Paludisphaera borealis]
MEETITRAWNDLLARDSGPLHFRLFLQPLVATILAIRAGWADAWAGRPIFFWTLVREPAQARTMLRNLWRSVGKVFLIAVALDVAYQLIVLQWIYPVETLIVATMLALVPCMVVRAVGNRVVTVMRQRRLRHMKRVSPDDLRGASDNSRATDRHDLTHQ